MNLFTFSLLALTIIVVLFLLIFLLIGGFKFFKVVTSMKDELSHLNNSVAGIIMLNNKDHESFIKDLKRHDSEIFVLRTRVNEHDKILKNDK